MNMVKKTDASQIISICKRLHDKGYLASADGNVSVRISDQEILITPTGKNKGFIEEKDIAVITLDNQVLSGNPSGERLMHLEVYKKSPKAKAVVHAHPPTAIAWSIACPDLEYLPEQCISEVILAVGKIPFVPYARPGTLNMGEVLHRFLPKYRALILSRHGALSWGEDLDEAYNGMERLEHAAEVLWRAKTLGALTMLPREEVLVLEKMREKLGERIL